MDRTKRISSKRNVVLAYIVLYSFVLHAVPTVSAQDGGFAKVRHARGAVRFQMPNDWQVAEEPAGRQIRLVLTPTEKKKNSIDSMWMSLRYHPTGVAPLETEALAEFGERLLDKLTRRKADIDSVAEWGKRGVKFELRLPATKKKKEKADKEIASKEEQDSGGETGSQEDDEIESDVDADSDEEAPRELDALFLIQQVSWARLEIFVTRPRSADASHWPDVERLLESVVLKRPKATSPKSKPSVKSATPILGSWKASRSRMRLAEDGTITIVTDKPFEVEELDEDSRELDDEERKKSDKEDAGKGKDKAPRLATTIHGKYSAKRDLLFVVWSDGSKLNYRWRKKKGDLLLTDNKGRTSKLWPILD